MSNQIVLITRQSGATISQMMDVFSLLERDSLKCVLLVYLLLDKKVDLI